MNPTDEVVRAKKIAEEVQAAAVLETSPFAVGLILDALRNAAADALEEAASEMENQFYINYGQILEALRNKAKRIREGKP